ncbi:hypothetical protein ACP3P8_05265 [Pseudomonas aeruginosa]
MPMTEGHHSPDGCCNLEEFAPQAQAEQAEAERPEVVAWRYGFSGGIVSDKACLDEWKSGGEYQSLMTVAQHERIVGALRFERQQMDRAFTACINERDTALAKVAELDQALAEKDPFGAKLNRISEKLERCDALLAARAAQAGQVPQAWLDVQAERKRQVEVEGWTPEHDDEHNGGELADAAACYALSAAGWSTYAARERWPWPLEWWKPSTARRDLVKACALALAEIERLDRAAASQEGQAMHRALTALGLIATLGLAAVFAAEVFPILRTLAAWQTGCFG